MLSVATCHLKFKKKRTQTSKERPQTICSDFFFEMIKIEFLQYINSPSETYGKRCICHPIKMIKVNAKKHDIILH